MGAGVAVGEGEAGGGHFFAGGFYNTYPYQLVSSLLLYLTSWLFVVCVGNAMAS